MYKAAVGESDSQQSGKAILALQRESDTGTFHFADNLSRSIRHAGRIMVDLIPRIYDTRRIVRILGEDGSPQAVTIDPSQAQAKTQFQLPGGAIRNVYNLGVGRYDVTVTVGPSYTTARQEAATVLTELANSAKDPASAAVMRYLAVKNSDFHGSEEMVKMLKALLPPALQQDPNQQQIPPAVMQKMQQMDQMMQVAAERIKELESGAEAAKAKVAVQAQEAQAKIQLAQQELQLEQQKVQAELALEREKVAAEIALEREKLQAELTLEAAKMNGQLDVQKQKARGEYALKAIELNQPESPEAAQSEKEQGEAEEAARMKKIMDEAQAQTARIVEAVVAQLSKPKEVSGTLPSGAHFSAVVH